MGYNIIASDASDVFIEVLRKNTALEIRKINILKDTLPKVDAIYINSVLHHFNNEQMKDIVDKVYSTLPINGIIAFVTRSGNKEGLIDEKVDVPRYFKYRTESEVKSILESSSYKVIYSNDLNTQFGSFLFFIAKKA